jgi:hypothetical protein
MGMAAPRLLFVYNADSGVLNALADMVHKIVSPATYPCSLCALTYGWFAMDRDWRRFLKRLPAEPVFYHRDEFMESYPQLSIGFPAILLERGDGTLPGLLISAHELDGLDDLGQLMALLMERLK